MRIQVVRCCNYGERNGSCCLSSMCIQVVKDVSHLKIIYNGLWFFANTKREGWSAAPSALLCRSYVLRRRQAYGGRWKAMQAMAAFKRACLSPKWLYALAGE
jgi:hypothetical protein